MHPICNSHAECLPTAASGQSLGQGVANRDNAAEVT